MHKKHTGSFIRYTNIHNRAPAQTRLYRILTSILECTSCISRCCNDFPKLHKHQAEKSLKSSPTESHYMHVLMRRHPEIKLSLSSCLAERFDTAALFDIFQQNKVSGMTFQNFKDLIGSLGFILSLSTIQTTHHAFPA